MTNYNEWGNRELIEKCENAELFASEVAEYFDYISSLQVGEGLSDTEIILQEQARKLAGLKIQL